MGTPGLSFCWNQPPEGTGSLRTVSQTCPAVSGSFQLGLAQPRPRSGEGFSLDPAGAWCPWKYSPHGEAAPGTWPGLGLGSTGAGAADRPGLARVFCRGEGRDWEGTSASVEAAVPRGLRMAAPSLPGCRP